MKPFLKKLELVLLGPDEHELSLLLRQEHPACAFVDGEVFPTPAPILSQTIDRARESQVLLWERSNFPELPVVRDAHGRWTGPTVGPVVQYLRPMLFDDRMRSGWLAASGGVFEEAVESANNAFIRHVWAAAKKLSMSVQCVDEAGQVLNDKVVAFRAGLHAAEWLRKKPGRFFTDASRNLYVPLEAARKRVPRKESKS